MGRLTKLFLIPHIRWTFWLCTSVILSLFFLKACGPPYSCFYLFPYTLSSRGPDNVFILQFWVHCFYKEQVQNEQLKLTKYKWSNWYNSFTSLGSASSYVFVILIFGYLIQLLGVRWKQRWGHKFKPCVSSLLSSILWPHSPLASCLENAWYRPPEDGKRYGGSEELHNLWK